MPKPHAPEFRRRAVEFARLYEKPAAQIAEDLGISDSCLRNRMRQADIDDGRREGTSSSDQAERAQPRRVAKMEVEILKRRPHSSPRRACSQNDLHLHRRALFGPAGRDVSSRDEGIDLRVLRVEGLPSQRP
jgi:transposase